jgi:hypothetical protein
VDVIEGLWFGPTSGSMAVETAFRAAPEIAAQVRAPMRTPRCAAIYFATQEFVVGWS